MGHSDEAFEYSCGCIGSVVIIANVILFQPLLETTWAKEKIARHDGRTGNDRTA